VRPEDHPQPRSPRQPRRRARQVTAVIAGILVTALVAAGVTLGVLRLQSRTNPQSVDLRSGVTIAEDSAIVQAAAHAKPAVVSVVTQRQPRIVSGSGYLVTSDGYIVTSVDVVTGSAAMTVLLLGDAKTHSARLVDYDCQTGVAVLKVDQVTGLPTLAFGDATALVEGQRLVAVAGPLDGSAATPGFVVALHRPVSITDPLTGVVTREIADTIQTDIAVDAPKAGGPLLNVGGQVVGIAMQGSGGSAFGLDAADVQDDVQQILQTGQVVVSSMGVTTTSVSAQMAALKQIPAGGQLLTVDRAGPAAVAGLQVGDVITQLDDVRVDAAHPLSLLMRSRFHPNQRVIVTYSRGSSSAQLQLTLTGEHPVCA
jgi:putative serine protease PepD